MQHKATQTNFYIWYVLNIMFLLTVTIENMANMYNDAKYI